MISGFAEDESTSNVGVIAFDEAAVIDHDDGVFLDGLRGQRTMRVGAVLAHLDARLAAETHLPVGLVNQRPCIGLGHARLQCLVNRLINF